MKDRLMKLLKGNPYLWMAEETILSIADHLLFSGVIVPPVSIGDNLWDIYYNKPREWKVVYLGFNGKEWHINVHWSNKDRFLTKEVDGKYLDRMFFRTKEEAEQALKEREQSDR